MSTTDFTQAAAAPRVPARTWLVIITLGLSGQIAWNVENTWFNTFVYDTITTDSRPIAVMTAVSALVATLTTLLVGAHSDRIGRRKPIIVGGYVLWALSTALYPVSAIPEQVGFAIFLVIGLDAVMTFFGSSANDASFNAWVTDVTAQGNRGVVEAVLQALPVVATVIGMGVSGFVIDRWGYTLFFLVLGGLVLAMGLVGGSHLQESPDLRPTATASVWATLRAVFAPQSIKANANLFLVFVTWCVFSIGLQISWPYEVIYLNNTLGISKSQAGVITAMVAPVLLLLAWPIGRLVDRGHGFAVAATGYIISALGFAGFSMTSHFVVLAGFGVLKSVGILMAIVLGTWHRNLLPEDARGAYQGVRLVFVVLIPMVLGSAMGSLIIETSGGPPPPAIYWASAVVVGSALIPVAILRRRLRLPAGRFTSDRVRGAGCCGRRAAPGHRVDRTPTAAVNRRPHWRWPARDARRPG